MTSEPQPPFFGMDWDDTLEKSPEAAEVIYRAHFRLERWLKVRAAHQILDLKLVQDFHRLLFVGVFPDFAGRLRGPSPDFVARNVTFGNYRGTEFEQVPSRCERLMDTVRGHIQELDEQREREAATFETDVVKAASYVHCELIRIHPFTNGNGRVSRQVVNYFAWRYGYNPIPIARPQRAAYLAAIRTWLRGDGIAEFMDFLAPLFSHRSEE